MRRSRYTIDPDPFHHIANCLYDDLPSLKSILACSLDNYIPGIMMEQDESLLMVKRSDTGKVRHISLHMMSQQVEVLLTCREITLTNTLLKL